MKGVRSDVVNVDGQGILHILASLDDLGLILILLHHNASLNVTTASAGIGGNTQMGFVERKRLPEDDEKLAQNKDA